MTTTKRFYVPRHWTLAQRLAHYTAPPNERGCTLWTGYCSEDGYGILWFDGQLDKVHRWTWIEERGPIPNGMHVLHRCDTPPCRTLEHLFLGTNADNVADREAKGRNVTLVGAQHGMARLANEQVLAIRADPRMHRIIAADYGVDRTTVTDIKRRKTWRHL